MRRTIIYMVRPICHLLCNLEKEKILLHTNRREEEEEDKEKERREPHLVGSKLDRKQHAICRNDEMG